MIKKLARCTAQLRSWLAVAVELAEQRGRSAPNADDLLDSLAWFQSCLALSILKELGVFLNRLRPAITVSRGLSIDNRDSLGEELILLLDTAFDEARLLDHDYCGTEHMLLSILSSCNCSAASFLLKHGVSYAAAKSTLVDLFAERMPIDK